MMENDYNRRLANNLSQINYALSKKDTLTDVIGVKGGAISKLRSTDTKNMYIQDLASVGNKYIMNGTSANYPMLNMNELRLSDKEKSNPLYYQKLHNSQLKGGINWGDVGNFFKPIGSAILDIAAPAVGAFVGGPVGSMAAKAVREGVRGATGVGLKKGRAGAKSGGVKTAGVGKYKSGGKLSQEEKDARIAKKEAEKELKKMEREQKKTELALKKPNKADRPKRKVSSAVNERANIVKSIMKDMGLKMTDASSYVKKHNLYKK